MLRASAQKLAKKLGVAPKDVSRFDFEHHPLRVLPYQKSPVVIFKENQLQWEWMQFSLLPRWSKQKRVKFATHNARLESEDPKSNQPVMIYDKPTWRDAFKKRHCLIPISDFIEPIYTGHFQGNMVRFFSEGHELLVAAGIWEEWIGEDGEVIESYSILTHEPHPFVKRLGHDRSPVFLQESAFDSWLQSESRSPQAWVRFLKTHLAAPELNAESDRKMKGSRPSRRE